MISTALGFIIYEQPRSRGPQLANFKLLHCARLDKNITTMAHLASPSSDSFYVWASLWLRTVVRGRGVTQEWHPSRSNSRNRLYFPALLIMRYAYIRDNLFNKLPNASGLRASIQTTCDRSPPQRKTPLEDPLHFRNTISVSARYTTDTVRTHFTN